MRRLILLSLVLTFPNFIANAQNPLAGVTKLNAEGVGVGNTGAASGTLRGDPVGFANWTYSLNGAPPQSNGSGGVCDFASGTLTITATDGSTLQMNHAGVSCDTGLTLASPAIDQTVYIITSGTGRFTNAAGTGNVAIGWYRINSNPQGAAQVYIHIDGNIDLH